MTDASEPQAPAVSRSQQKAATRARILAAASALFSERDYADVTVADIARGAGVAHGLVFHHFASKEGVYRAVLDAVVAEMDAAFVVPDGVGTPELVRVALETHLTYLAEHRGVALRLVVGRRHLDPTAASVSARGRASALESLAGLLGLDPAERVVQQVGASVAAAFDEATRWWLEDPDPAPVGALVTSLLELGAGALRGARVFEGCPDVSGPLDLLAAACAVPGGVGHTT